MTSMRSIVFSTSPTGSMTLLVKSMAKTVLEKLRLGMMMQKLRLGVELRLMQMVTIRTRRLTMSF